jgi:hypothetical protein
MPRWRRYVGFSAIGGLMFTGAAMSTTLTVPTGYASHILCSAHFVGGRDIDHVKEHDLEDFWYVDATVDEAQQSVTAEVAGMADATAVFREGLGCTHAYDIEPEQLREQALPVNTAFAADAAWPTADGVDERPNPAGLDRARLDAAVASAFEDPDPESPLRTYAVIVVHDDRIVAERYADGIDRNTRLLGWSMTKSVTSALVGILVGEGKLDIQSPAPVSEWSEDDRAAITLDQLLRMSSGLDFPEVYLPFSPALEMLFESRDAAAVAIDASLGTEPGTTWAYSSGTTNIITRIMRDQFDSLDDYHAFPRQALFEPIGMHSAVMEPDASGTFIGSSFMHATARDWARFGLLYLHDGVWDGRRILPEGWVDYSRTPTPTHAKGYYAAHWWTNGGRQRQPSLPEDAYQAQGYQGQAVMVIPSRDAVIVRLGMTHQLGAWNIEPFAAEVLASLPN